MITLAKVNHMPALDGMARAGAEACCQALTQRFGHKFVAVHLRMGTWEVVSDASPTPSLFERMTGFAEGFLASTSLWER